MAQAKDFTFNDGTSDLTFEVLSPAGPNSPAEFRLVDDSKAPMTLPYLSIKARGVNGALARKASIMYIEPIVNNEGVRTSQNVWTLESRIDLSQTTATTQKGVARLIKLLQEDFITEALTKAVAPN